jgi:hypothetical protein
MSGRTIRTLITLAIFSVAAGLLCEAIIDIGWDLLKGYRGTLSGPLGWTKGFFFQLPLIFARGLALAAPIAFCAEGLFAARLEGNRRYRAVLVASLGYVGLAVVMMFVYIKLVLDPGLSITRRDLIDMILMPLLILRPLLFPVSALSIFGFWLPTVATGLYCRLSKHPRWWLAGLLGTLTLLAGVLLWSSMGDLVGAETD